MVFKNQIRIAGLLHTDSIPALAASYELGQSPRQYILSKLDKQQVVFLELLHKKKAVLQLLSGLIPLLHEAEVTDLSLEITSDQQDKLNQYCQIGIGLAEIQLHPRIDSPGYRNLVVTVHWLNPNYRLSIVALDLPTSLYGRGIGRDEWMANRIADIFKANPEAKMLVLLGTFHVLKEFPSQVGQVLNEDLSVPEYLEKTVPDIRRFFIGQVIDEDPAHCDFTRQLGPIRGAVAVDFDQRFASWRIGWLYDIEIKLPEICEFVDGLVIY